MRYRVVRGVGLVAVLAVVAGGFYAVRTNPVSWAQSRWDDINNTAKPVTGITAQVEPPEAAEVEFPPADAVDSSGATAWRTAWAVDGPPLTTCGLGSRAAVLSLSLPAPVEVRAVDVVVGGPVGTDAAAAHWRPKLLGLQFTDGTCQTVTAADGDGTQHLDIAPVNTQDVKVWVLDAWPPEVPGGTEVAISEITLLSRPQR